jgi:hypothetical protein
MRTASDGLTLSGVPGTLRSVLKRAEGQCWSVPQLQPTWRDHVYRRLVEPLVGDPAVTLDLLPQKALLSDINYLVVSFYRRPQGVLRFDIEARSDQGLYRRQRDGFISWQVADSAWAGFALRPPLRPVCDRLCS